MFRWTPWAMLWVACSSGDPSDPGSTSETDGVIDTDTPVTDTEDTDTPQTGCVPTGAVFDENIRPILEAKCAECHGEVPAYGAPYAITEYDDIVAGDIGDRKVDRMLERLVDDTMPPSNATALLHAELDTLVGWTSCGAMHPPEPEGLDVNRDKWEAGATPPADTSPYELTADEEVIGPTVLDDYRSFTFGNIVNESMFIRRIEPIIDDSRVLHHITLTRAPLGFPFLYAWAPGTEAIQLDDGGIRLDPGDSLKVEIHYNNGAGVSDAVDSSGVRLWLGDPDGVEYGVMSPQTWNINVPANSTSTASQSCTAPYDYEIVAAMPHMHEIGDTFLHDVERVDGTIDNLIDLTGWSFESQFYYETPMQIFAGDQLHMTCGYDNPHGYTVRAGDGTGDEMCFDFLVVTPAKAALLCLF